MRKMGEVPAAESPPFGGFIFCEKSAMRGANFSRTGEKGRAAMGIFLNPGTGNLVENLNSRFYVDKSMLLAKLNSLVSTQDKFICTSRARRFGKTMAGNMIAAYYSKNCDSREIFSRLKIAKDPSFEKYLNKFNVIQLDINGLLNTSTTGSVVKDADKYVREEFIEQFPDISFDGCDSIPQCMNKVFKTTGEKFVIIMDEYDVMVRDPDVKEEQFREYLLFLNGMFKNTSLSQCIALAYLTGILPIIRDRVQSKLNVFREYSMVDAGQFSEFVGFTKDEVKELCDANNMNFEEVTNYYDGYLMIDGTHIYNPKSVVEAMTRRRIDGYWTQTGHFGVLADYVRMDFQGLHEDVNRMMAGEKIPVNVSTYLNTMRDFSRRDDVLACLIHLGYLTYQHLQFGSGLCWIPNREIMQQWAVALEVTPGFENVMKIVNASKQLVEDTLAMNAGAVARGLDAAHQFVANNYNYNNEMALQSAVMLAYFHAIDRFFVFKEPELGNGRADVLLVPSLTYGRGLPAVIIELKKDGSAGSALDQIKNKEYFKELENYSGDILFVGINYDSETKKHSCGFEKLVK